MTMALMLLPVVQIPIGHGRFALINECDAPAILPFRWHMHGSKTHPKRYAATSVAANCKCGRGVILMHRMLLGAKEIDHKNGNGFDNRRSNLRPSSRSGNLVNRGRRVLRKDGGKFKGVYWHACSRKWHAKLTVKGQKLFIGHFTSEEEAARAYNKAAFQAWGHLAKLNQFP
jgi:hypothetical protein